jgi:hypothetical protein
MRVIGKEQLTASPSLLDWVVLDFSTPFEILLGEEMSLRRAFSLLPSVLTPPWVAFLDGEGPVLNGDLILGPGATKLRGTTWNC